eukprot:gene13543-19414_t
MSPLPLPLLQERMAPASAKHPQGICNESPAISTMHPQFIRNASAIHQQCIRNESPAISPPAGKDSSCIRNASEDMKRALGALGTKESEAEFQKGGGGKRAQMMVMLTEAKAGQVAPSAKGGQAADASKNVNDTGEGDWRMKAPIRDEIVPMPRFKPGASTWDTDDPAAVAAASAAAAKAQNRKKSTWGGPGGKEPGSAAGAAKSSAPRGMTPQERYEAEGHVKYEEGASTTGAASRSFTSTCQTVTTVNKRSLRRVDRNPSKKGYVRLHTNLGDLNFELSCDLAPRTCENFIALCEMGYYEGTTFHRSIKNFMVQAPAVPKARARVEARKKRREIKGPAGDGNKLPREATNAPTSPRRNLPPRLHATTAPTAGEPGVPLRPLDGSIHPGKPETKTPRKPPARPQTRPETQTGGERPGPASATPQQQQHTRQTKQTESHKDRIHTAPSAPPNGPRSRNTRHPNRDELDSRLVHNGRGILSMANSGPNSNGSQFFISYKSCRHLDFKHSVFGRVVGGFEVLSAMEKVPCDSDDHPTTEIKILSASVFANPYKEMEEEEKKSDEAKAAADAKASSLANPEDDGKRRFSVEGLVGLVNSYAPLQQPKPKAAPALGSSDAMPPPAKKKKAAPAFGNFDAW